MTDTFTALFTDEDGNLVLEEEFQSQVEAEDFCTRHEDNGLNSDVRHPDGTLHGVN
tara:strand:- start:7971 stop:8138 length:168 start_codon:yes stop_codon:yes gene_type:complete